jgi:hypothetical protein
VTEGKFIACAALVEQLTPALQNFSDASRFHASAKNHFTLYVHREFANLAISDFLTATLFREDNGGTRIDTQVAGTSVQAKCSGLEGPTPFLVSWLRNSCISN